MLAHICSTSRGVYCMKKFAKDREVEGVPGPQLSEKKMKSRKKVICRRSNVEFRILRVESEKFS